MSLAARGFNPLRLALARQRRGLNKTELAELIGVTRQSVVDYERDFMAPTEETLAKCAAALRFPIEFFAGPDPQVPQIEASSFRSLTSMSASQRDAALAAGALAIDLSHWIAKQRFRPPAPSLPDLRGVLPEAAASMVRELWGVGTRPIHSMIDRLELCGVRVFSLAEQAREVDAFSLWHGDVPYCFLNTVKSAEHGRMDAAHELGHLVLHKHGGPGGRPAENEANAFASALLMPASTIRAQVPRNANMARVVELKRTWGVSAVALAYRAHHVGVFSDWHYRGLCIQMAQSGYRTAEPQPITNRETSQILRKIFDALRKEGRTRADVAKELLIYPPDLDAMVFGLVLGNAVGGTGGQAGAMRPQVFGRPRLVPPSDGSDA